MTRTVVVGLSGGVDSSVSAYLLKEAGYRVIGLFMKNWEEKTAHGVCQSQQDFEDVLRVAEMLDIPAYSVEFIQEYRDLVFEDFLTNLKKGRTPNPDILCNREIKFQHFLKKAQELGADLLATGHYCQLDEHHRLLKGADPLKDQSYFLSAVPQAALTKVVFPIGHLHKQQVRQIAREKKLPTAMKKDSTGICFIGKRDFRPFTAQYLGYEPGPFKTVDGAIVGTHTGAAFYTKGQRRGMGLGGEGEAWYVASKDMPTNTVFVARGEDHPSLFSKELIASSCNFFGPHEELHRCHAKVRYRQAEQLCHVELFEDKVHVIFDDPQRAVTEGQSVVFYKGNYCLGGAIIDQVLS